MNWDIVKLDAYKLVNNLKKEVDINLDFEVNVIVKYLEERYDELHQEIIRH